MERVTETTGHKLAQKKYRQSEKGKKTNKRYRESSKGIVATKKWVKKYHSSEKGKQCLRRGHLRRTFGITEIDFDRMLAQQRGVCAICLTDNPRGMGRFHIDHCHKTNKIRGLLCTECNSLLGKAKDNTTILQAAIVYLEKG